MSVASATSFHVLDWAVVCAYLAIVVVLGLRFRRRAARRREFFLAARSMPVWAVAISVLAIGKRRNLWSLAGLFFSALCALSLALYVFVISATLPSTEGVVQVGEPAPAFQLPDHTGQPVALSDYAGSQLVLVFYRGYW